MKYFICLWFILLLQTIINGQKLIGAWQERTPQIMDTYIAVYQFSDDSLFSYYINHFDGINSIEKICGKYKIQGDIIILTVNYIVTSSDGYIEKEETGTRNYSWIIAGSKPEKKYLDAKKNFPCSFKYIGPVLNEESNISTEAIEINGFRFYKIEFNPNEF